MIAEEKAGRPFLVLSHCLPHGMPSWMLITHNAFELLTTPGRITMLGEVDGNRMRRIYMDGRSHPEDPDLTLHGHSIGHWEGDMLVSTPPRSRRRPISRSARRPAFRTMATCTSSSGCIWQSRTCLHDDLEITAPKVLTATWKTTRIFRRYPERHYEITEGECVQEDLVPGKDQFGNDIFVPNRAEPGRLGPHVEIRMIIDAVAENCPRCGRPELEPDARVWSARRRRTIPTRPTITSIPKP